MKKDYSAMVSRVPDSPGVYLMKDETGAVIYVGKAYNLKKELLHTSSIEIIKIPKPAF